MATDRERGEKLFAALLGDPESLWNAAKEYIGDNCEPGDIFDTAQLEAWAKARGFQLPEE